MSRAFFFAEQEMRQARAMGDERKLRDHEMTRPRKVDDTGSAARTAGALTTTPWLYLWRMIGRLGVASLFRQTPGRLTTEVALQQRANLRKKSQLAGLRVERKRLRDLVRHMWVHDGYRQNGRQQMTTEQKKLYDSITSAAVEAEPQGR